MKKKYTIIKNLGLLAVILSIFAACEKDFASLDSDVVNSENTTHFLGEKESFPLVTYNKAITPFQSNDLPDNVLGHYNHPDFGSSSANFVTQIIPSGFNPDFGKNARVDSVILSIPFYSRATDAVSTGGFNYKLDSVYGSTPIRLTIFQNNYFLRDFDPDADLNLSQKYYSNGTLSQSNTISPADLEGTMLLDTVGYTPSEKQIVLFQPNTATNTTDTIRTAPAMRFKLDNPNGDYWENVLFEKQNDPEFSNRNNFLNYFRGLFFKAEGINGIGSMAQLNFTDPNSNLIIYYKHDKDPTDEDNDGIPDYADVDKDGDGTNDNGEDTDGDGINNEHDVDETEGEDENSNGIDDSLDTVKTEFSFSFSGNLVNIMDDNINPIPPSDIVNGDEKLLLKGGEGSMAILELFNGTVINDEGIAVDAYDNFIEKYRKVNDNGVLTPKRLINEAFLEFYVDQNSLNIEAEEEPNRLYIYDLKNNTPLIDYILDQSSTSTSLSAKINHLPELTREETNDDDVLGKGIKYKIRITEHLTNIFLRDSSNVKLGLVVMPGINTINMYPLSDQSDDAVKQIPSGSILSPLGTILFGNNTLDENKKAKLTIYYTDPSKEDESN